MTKLKRYQEHGLKTTKLACPAEPYLPRRTRHSLLSAWSGHADFKFYHRRMGHDYSTRTAHAKRSAGPSRPLQEGPEISHTVAEKQSPLLRKSTRGALWQAPQTSQQVIPFYDDSL